MSGADADRSAPRLATLARAAVGLALVLGLLTLALPEAAAESAGRVLVAFFIVVPLLRLAVLAWRWASRGDRTAVAALALITVVAVASVAAGCTGPS